MLLLHLNQVIQFSYFDCIYLNIERRSPTQGEMKIYRKSFDAYHSISENEISLKILAEDTVLYTRTSNNMSCKDFLTKQLKKIPHDPSKTYGIYLVKGKLPT